MSCLGFVFCSCSSLIGSLWVVVVVVVVMMMMMVMVMIFMLMIPSEEISSFGCVHPAAERLVRGFGWLQQAGRRTCLVCVFVLKNE